MKSFKDTVANVSIATLTAKTQTTLRPIIQRLSEHATLLVPAMRNAYRTDLDTLCLHVTDESSLSDLKIPVDIKTLMSTSGQDIEFFQRRAAEYRCFIEFYKHCPCLCFIATRLFMFAQRTQNRLLCLRETERDNKYREMLSYMQRYATLC